MSDPSPSRRLLAAVLAVGLVANVTGLAIMFAIAPAGAANTPTPTDTLDEKAPYYSSNTTAVDNESWTEGRREPTLANVTHYLTRVQAFVVGDVRAQGGGWAGPMMVGLVVGGAVLGSTAGAGVGAVGGAVLLVTGVFGLVGGALAPSWLYPVLIFIVGSVSIVIVLRSFR